ncbi:hypothetical protein ABIE69_002273 [Rhodobacteraceae bacterium MBR-64]|jgi:hypothetical protein
MTQHSVLSSWIVSVGDFSETIRLFLSIPQSESLPAKAFVVSYFLVDQDDNILGEKIENLPVATANPIKGMNYNYVDGNMKRSFGLLELRTFRAPKAAESVIVEMRPWSLIEKYVGTPELLHAVEAPGYNGLLLKRVPSRVKGEGAADA